MSRIITNTNIIVDDFDFCKSFPKGTFHHFLTHFHSDHYEGLSPLWDYAHIHTTHQTKKFILDKYPKLQNIHSYDYYKHYTLQIAEGIPDVTFSFFDAKHIPGAAMILFSGYMGSILFTGDFRYEYAMVRQNSILFPPHLRDGVEKQDEVEKMTAISISIDQMIFDNTYCNKAFQFQTESHIVDKMIAIIEKNKHKKLIYIAMGALGKHRILMKLCQHFQTLAVVSQKQKRKIELANLSTDFLTTKSEQGFIHLISKKNRAEIVEKTKRGPLGDSFICIDTDFLMLEHQSPDGINYIVPYSLHSNYKQMQTFIRMVQPCILRKIVIPYANFKQVKLKIKIDFRLKFAKYLDFCMSDMHHSEAGYSHLVKQCTDISILSKSYLKWFRPQTHKILMKLLGLGDGTQNHDLRKRKPVIKSDEELSNKSNFSQGRKQSLKNIADRLNAVNKNKTIQKAFSVDPEKIHDRNFNRIFNEDDQTGYSETNCKKEKNTQKCNEHQMTRKHFIPKKR